MQNQSGARAPPGKGRERLSRLFAYVCVEGDWRKVTQGNPHQEKPG